MDLDLTEEQLMVQRAVRDFLAHELAPQAAENDRRCHFPIEVFRELGRLGFLGGPIPEAFGGSGFDPVSYGLIIEEIGYVDSSMRSAFSVQVGLVELPILAHGNDEQKKRYLPRLCKGEIVGCFGLTEPNAGSDAANQQTTAVRDGDSWVLNGSKTWITNGGIADVAIVYAQTDREKRHRGITGFIVERGMRGFSTKDITGKLGLRSSVTSELIFQDVRVPDANRLGEIGQGFAIAMASLDNGRFSVASGCVGTARACLDASVRYARERNTFGKPIAQHQAIQEMIADMALGVDAGRLLCLRVGHLKSKGRPCTREICMAKLYCSEMVNKAAYDAIQIHGAYGYSDEYPVERFYRDARVMTIYEGTSQIQRLIIASDVLGLKGIG